MTDQFSFEHEQGFQQGELSGQLRLGKFEAHYEELFAEVIEDGIITLEERARLNKAADALGRHRVRVREMADEQDAPASIVLTPEPTNDPRVAMLERRIAQLEALVADLT